MLSSRNGTYSAGCDRMHIQHNAEERIQHIRLCDEVTHVNSLIRAITLHFAIMRYVTHVNSLQR